MLEHEWNALEKDWHMWEHRWRYLGISMEYVGKSTRWTIDAISWNIDGICWLENELPRHGAALSTRLQRLNSTRRAGRAGLGKNSTRGLEKPLGAQTEEWSCGGIGARNFWAGLDFGKIVTEPPLATSQLDICSQHVTSTSAPSPSPSACVL